VSKSRALKQLRIGKNSYYFFNLYGLEIRSSKNWGDFMFNDATIINTDQLKSLIRIEFSDVSYENVNRRLNGHSILLVRKFGVNSFNKLKENDKEMEAHIRAKEITSFIFLVFFQLSGFRYGISLDSELYESSGFNSSLIDSSGNISYRSRNIGYEYYIMLPKKPFNLSKTILVNIFKRSIFRNLYNIIINQNESNKHLRSSLLNYYLSLNTPSPTTQFLGSISSLELLLKNKSSYEQFLKRKSLLLSGKLKEKFSNIDEYIGNRHKIVHAAASVDLDILHIPVYLYCYILPIYIELFNIHRSNDQVLKFIDLVIQENKITLKGSNYYLKKFDKTLAKQKYLTDYSILNIIQFYNPNDPTNYNRDILQIVYCISKMNDISVEKAYLLLSKHFLISEPFNDLDEFFSEYKMKLSDFKDMTDTAIDEKWIR
jgi:hypothetical protein